MTATAPETVPLRIEPEMPKNGLVDEAACPTIMGHQSAGGKCKPTDPRHWRDRAISAAKSDMVAGRAEFVISMPDFVRKWLLIGLRDERDMPVAVTLVGMLLLVLPAAGLLYLSSLLGNPSHVQGFLYFVFIQGLFLQRYLVALLHTTEHRPIFYRGKRRLVCSTCVFVFPVK
jgi:hypothetical protein